MPTHPNLFIVGAPKAGTTTLYSALAEHPDVYVSPRKEPHFLAIEDENFVSHEGHSNHMKTIRTHPLPVHSEASYKALFEGGDGFTVAAEASTLYLYSKYAPRRIAQCYPAAKVVAILRHPVDRAYSQFLHHVRDTHETTTDFENAFLREDERLSRGPFWHYERVGKYARQVERYRKYLSEDRIRIFLFEDLVSDPRHVVRKVFNFINVDASVGISLGEKKNATGLPQNRFIHYLLSMPWRYPFLREIVQRTPKSIRRVMSDLRRSNLSKPALEDEVRVRLTKRYDDIDRLQELIGRDLSHWREAV